MADERDQKASVKFAKARPPATKPVAMGSAAVIVPAAVAAPAAAEPVVPFAGAPAETQADPIAEAVSATIAAAAQPVAATPEPVIPAAPIEVQKPEPAIVAPVEANIEPARPSNVTPIRKDNFMATMQDTANEAAKTFTNNAETAVSTGKQAMEQVASKSREALEHGMKSMDDMTNLAKGNVEAMLASSKAATTGFETIAQQVADYARKSFEETTAAARALTTVKTPNELMQLQNDFAKTQFDRAVAEMSKLSEAMVKMMGEVMEPVQNRAATTAETVKNAGQAWTNKIAS